MNRANFSKCAVAKRKRNAIEIRDHIRASIEITVDADRARILINAAADIENRKLGSEIFSRAVGFERRAYRSRACRHCSSVSMAQSACSRVMTRGGHKRRLF